MASDLGARDHDASTRLQCDRSHGTRPVYFPHLRNKARHQLTGLSIFAVLFARLLRGLSYSIHLKSDCCLCERSAVHRRASIHGSQWFRCSQSRRPAKRCSWATRRQPGLSALLRTVSVVRPPEKSRCLSDPPRERDIGADQQVGAPFGMFGVKADALGVKRRPLCFQHSSRQCWIRRCRWFLSA